MLHRDPGYKQGHAVWQLCSFGQEALRFVSSFRQPFGLKKQSKAQKHSAVGAKPWQDVPGLTWC